MRYWPSVLFVVVLPTYVLAAHGTFQANISPPPPYLSAQVAFSEPSGNNILDAEENGTLTVKVTNNGKGDAFDVVAEVQASKQINGLSFEKRLEIGTMPSGNTVTKVISLVATEELPTESLTFAIELKEVNGFDSQPVKISFKTKAFEPPKLVLADLGIADQNGNGKIEPMEIVEVTARVQNIGRGDARNVIAEIQLGQNVFLAGDSVTRFELGNIASGEYKDVKFSFYTNNRLANGQQIPLTLNMVEARPRFNSKQLLALNMNVPQKNAQEFVVKAVERQIAAGDIQLAGGLSVDVDQNIPEGARGNKDDVAVVIGNRNYSAAGAPDVDFAARDAQVMREYLTHTMGFDNANIIYAEDASQTKFNDIFGTDRYEGKLSKWVKPGKSRVFVYYVGHGAPDMDSGEAYFVPVDANPQNLKATGYRLQTFYDNLAKISAKSITVVIDACFSGNSAKGTLLKGTSALARYEKTPSRTPVNALVISSSSSEQVSSWYPDKKHSLFTYYFLKGLGGEADANKDGRITAGEMRAYLGEHVTYMARRLTGNEQTPQVSGRDSELLAEIKH